MRHVTFRQLQIFAEAARALSFARVADRLHLTPAAVSFQVKQLETISGFALFERMGKKLVLTDAGEALFGHANVVLQALHDADAALTALKGLGGGRVTVGLVSTLVSSRRIRELQSTRETAIAARSSTRSSKATSIWR